MTKPTGNPEGRPPMYDDPELMQTGIDEYFEKCDVGEEIEVYSQKKKEVIKYTRKTPYTVPGLAYYLGFASRNALLDYAKKAEFQGTITRAKLKIELQRNEQALGGAVDSKFSQFDLKNNFGWRDQQDINLKVKTLEDVIADLEDE